MQQRIIIKTHVETFIPVPHNTCVTLTVLLPLVTVRLKAFEIAALSVERGSPGLTRR